MDGFINLLKPPGMTSHDVVAHLRKTLRIKKIGHTGTLDPGVAGVLPICLGKATRLAEYVTELPKSYRGEITFGKTTDTQDAYGEVNEICDCTNLKLEQFLNALPLFQGEIEQIPPMVSAVRVGGKHLYELAREGREVERKAKTISVYSFSIFKSMWEPPFPKAIFDVSCSKGTYIRTLCHDIGQHLVVGAHMSYLIRTGSGPFRIEDSCTLEEIGEMYEDGNWSFVQTPERGVSFLPAIEVDDLKSSAIAHGNPVTLSGNSFLEAQVYRILNSEKKLLAVGYVEMDQEGFRSPVLKPLKVLVSP